MQLYCNCACNTTEMTYFVCLPPPPPRCVVTVLEASQDPVIESAGQAARDVCPGDCIFISHLIGLMHIIN